VKELIQYNQRIAQANGIARVIRERYDSTLRMKITVENNVVAAYITNKMIYVHHDQFSRDGGQPRNTWSGAFCHSYALNSETEDPNFVITRRGKRFDEETKAVAP
jgi:hypothetical protein